MALRYMPKTLALIPDGNRRWARQNRLSVLNGYSLGVNKFIDFSEWCMKYGIENITVWAFSADNIRRPKMEVNALFRIYERIANDNKIIERLHRNRTKVNIISNPAVIPKRLISVLKKVERETSVYNERVINILLGYGGREDIMFALHRLRRMRGFSPAEFSRSLMSRAVPDIDLIIRTSGEMRLSGFIPWQSSYSELYFSKKLWPDFTKRDLAMALSEYNKRERRFGR